MERRDIGLLTRSCITMEKQGPTLHPGVACEDKVLHTPQHTQMRSSALLHRGKY